MPYPELATTALLLGFIGTLKKDIASLRRDNEGLNAIMSDIKLRLGEQFVMSDIQKVRRNLTYCNMFD